METGSAQRQAVTGLPTSGSAGARRLRGHQEPVDLTILDNVQGKAFVYKYDQGTRRATPIPLPENASVSLQAASDETEEVMFAVSNFLRPTSLYYFDAASQRLEPLKMAPPQFDASQHIVEQFEATSRDGTRIPYFLVRPRNARFDGSTPTLLHGYGGFQKPLLPSYAGVMGRLWLEQGNAYVVANLRGGGEFGPLWHEAAQAATKQRTWDDFIAVAEDLIRRNVTSPRRLGVVGGSQGGLLVGTAITQRPDPFNAAIVQVPLFDMLRFTKLGAGASWTGEYGDPAIPEQREWLEAYSPYQKLVPGKTYPVPFILTSTKDDRVHPAHGRKAAARLTALGQPYFYYENIDGGTAPPPISLNMHAAWHSNTPMHSDGLWIESGPGADSLNRQLQTAADQHQPVWSPRSSSGPRRRARIL
ncbi:prolyl oligopeptidase family serine peptidase [Bradyrhizobium elkanii]|uniref:prolyl oligopeptidase family serine peptidase n=1 Tax=Bradyrhizobium elkanii TaxID=29448 RepID=UPI001FD87719|nr:prolyl oligopeptidase family serine peptidase [Bradyrhizobium elkanii]